MSTVRQIARPVWKISSHFVHCCDWLRMASLYSTVLVWMIFGVAAIAGLFHGTSYPPDVLEDGELDTEQLIQKYKYPAETHYITTDDNYILRVHRIPNPVGIPILLQHGLLDSSATFVLMGPTHSLGYYLHDKGYDVWMGNARGNRYSRNHTTLNPDTDEEFWNFSWHEIAVHDVPAMIDYIQMATNSQKLFYVGHSQGTTVLFVMCSLLPEYNEKIILAHALGPVAFMKHIRSPLLPYGQGYIKLPNVKAKAEFLPNANAFKGMLLNGGKAATDVWLNLFFSIMGKDADQLNKTKIPTILGHAPAGCSMKQFLHYNQLIFSERFCQFDYEAENQQMYSQSTPPDYNLTKVTVPLALHYGMNDFLTTPVDIMRLSEMLPNIVEVNKMALPQWNHMDFLYAIDVRKLLYEHMEDLNKKYD